MHGPEHFFFTPYCTNCDTTFLFLEESWPGGRSSKPMPCPTCGQILGNPEEDAELLAQARGDIGDGVHKFMSEEIRQKLERRIGTPEERQAELENLRAETRAKAAKRAEAENVSAALPTSSLDSPGKGTRKIKKQSFSMKVKELIAALQQEDPEAIVYVDVPQRYLRPIFYEALFAIEEVNKSGSSGRVNLFSYEPNIDHDDLSSWPESFRDEYILKEDHDPES